MKTSLFLLFCLLALTTASVAQTAPATTTAPATPTASLQEYTGTYTFESGSPVPTYTITVKDGELFGDAGMGTNKLLKQEAADQYKSTSSYGSIVTFTRDATSKQVTGLTLAAQGQQLTAKKEK